MRWLRLTAPMLLLYICFVVGWLALANPFDDTAPTHVSIERQMVQASIEQEFARFMPDEVRCRAVPNRPQIRAGTAHLCSVVQSPNGRPERCAVFRVTLKGALRGTSDVKRVIYVGRC